MEPVAIDWTYAISTLIIRFVGIFVVLGVLQVVMQITGRIFMHMDEKDAKTDALQTTQATASAGITEEGAAAVGIALYLNDQGR